MRAGACLAVVVGHRVNRWQTRSVRSRAETECWRGERKRNGSRPIAWARRFAEMAGKISATSARRRAAMSTGARPARRLLRGSCGRLRPRAASRKGAGCGGNKARARRVHVPVAVAALGVDIEALRHDQMQMILGAGHGDVEQPPLFLDLGAGAGREIGRDAAVDAVEQKDRVPFLALGRVDGRKDQIILIEQRRARLRRWWRRADRASVR